MILPLVLHDGGRAAAGYRGTARDCVVRAIAIAAELPYQEVYDELQRRNALFSTGRSRAARKVRAKGSTPRDGNFKAVYHDYILSLGFAWNPTMQIGSGCTVHLRSTDLPPGRLICQVTRHLTTVIDGKLYDIDDCSRGGTRCVYGYYSKKKN